MTKGEELRLIELAQTGDHDAASALIRAHQQSLFAYLLRMSGNPELSEDVVQDAFVRVLQNLHRFDPRFRFSTWLFTIAKRLYVNACQKMKPVYDTDIVGSRRGRDADPSTPTLLRERNSQARDAIGRALSQLSGDQREIILLFHQQEWPITRIAEFMGMPEGTVKSHLHRGRRKMRKYFELHESSAWSAEFAGVVA